VECATFNQELQESQARQRREQKWPNEEAVQTAQAQVYEKTQLGHVLSVLILWRAIFLGLLLTVMIRIHGNYFSVFGISWTHASATNVNQKINYYYFFAEELVGGDQWIIKWLSFWWFHSLVAGLLSLWTEISKNMAK
jgi:hypothetical protein